MTPVALVRHADTAWSREGRIQGRADPPLATKTPISLPAACRGMRIVTSPLARCIETAELLGARDAAREPRLIEMDWGDWEGCNLEGLRVALGKTMAENESRGLDFRPPRGESPREVLSRIRPWLRDIAHDAAPTLAVTHRGVIRAILAAASGWDMRGPPPAKLDWRAFHFFVVDGDGKPSIERLNVR